jgi:hypothetical protein
MTKFEHEFKLLGPPAPRPPSCNTSGCPCPCKSSHCHQPHSILTLSALYPTQQFIQMPLSTSSALLHLLPFLSGYPASPRRCILTSKKCLFLVPKHLFYPAMDKRLQYLLLEIAAQCKSKRLALHFVIWVVNILHFSLLLIHFFPPVTPKLALRSYLPYQSLSASVSRLSLTCSCLSSPPSLPVHTCFSHSGTRLLYYPLSYVTVQRCQPSLHPVLYSYLISKRSTKQCITSSDFPVLHPRRKTKPAFHHQAICVSPPSISNVPQTHTHTHTHKHKLHTTQTLYCLTPFYRANLYLTLPHLTSPQAKHNLFCNQTTFLSYSVFESYCVGRS